jgi:hypothetical protein
MNEERRRILNMLADRKITAEEADGLLEALGQSEPASNGSGTTPQEAKFLRVLVEGGEGDPGGKVNVRVPLNLLRAGVRLAALLPTVASDHINQALKKSGVDIDISKVKPENLEELVDHLRDLSVDVASRGEKVRVFCE